MRTTLTLDEDVAISLRRLCAERNQKFKQVVNQVLRAGLAALAEAKGGSHPPYQTEPVSLGRPKLPNLDNIAEVLAVAEGEEHT